MAQTCLATLSNSDFQAIWNCLVCIHVYIYVYMHETNIMQVLLVETLCVLSGDSIASNLEIRDS